MDLQNNFDCFSGLLLFCRPPFYLLKNLFLYLIIDAFILYCTSGISKCEVHGRVCFHAYRMIVTETHLLVLPWVSLLWSSRAEHSKTFHLQMPLWWHLSGSEHRSHRECFMLWRFRPSPGREQRRQAFPLGCTCRLTCSHLTDLAPLWRHHNISKMYTSEVFLSNFITRIMD